ncbi:MAG: aldo/keto reductase, partial [Gammaproteobacteria bacterium]|nr:aldo/keto reductase [Gammaproteobacteria bacterium]
MKTKQLGNSDLEVSVVGVGCMMFGSMCDQETTTSIINTALDEGVNFFDTANIYGA